MECPICLSSSSQALIKEACAYYRCERCGFLFHRSHNEGVPKSTHSFYDQQYWEMERAEALRREKEDSFLRAVELLYLSSIRVENILDFGCGLGVTVQLLRENLRLNAVGVDVSADFEETEYLHKCDLENLQQRYPAGYFDAIYSIEVFEHLEDPRSAVTRLGALLKPGGKILINTGTQEYISKYDPGMSYLDPVRRGHISIYSLQSLSELASTIGYGAAFLADRKYEVVLFPATSQAPFPHADNLERMKALGEWAPNLWREYMRLVFLEKEFDEKCRWIEQLVGEAGSHRRELVRHAASLLGGLSRQLSRILHRGSEEQALRAINSHQRHESSPHGTDATR